MEANFAAKVSFATPFVAATVAFVTALGTRAGFLRCGASISAGCVIGVAFGAFSGGFPNILLSIADRCTNPFCIVGITVAYVLLPIAFLTMACATVLYALRLDL